MDYNINVIIQYLTRSKNSLFKFSLVEGIFRTCNANPIKGIERFKSHPQHCPDAMRYSDKGILNLVFAAEFLCKPRLSARRFDDALL